MDAIAVLLIIATVCLGISLIINWLLLREVPQQQKLQTHSQSEPNKESCIYSSDNDS